MPLQARKIRDAFSRRYVAGLLILAVLATLAFGVTFNQTRFEETRAKTLTIAAGQPTASQRIAFLANAIAASDSTLERKEFRAELSRSIRDMQAAHDYLTLREPVAPGERSQLQSVQGIYFEGATPFDLEVAAFLDNARAVVAAPDEALQADFPPLARLNLAGSTFLMQTHGLIVRILQDRAEAAVRQSEMILAALWATKLLVLLLEGLFIFNPVGRRIERSIEQIEEAEARANAASASKSNFLRLISHEIRTPLNAVTGIAEILRKRAAAGEEAKEIALLLAASDHLMSLTGNVLDFSQLEAGKFVLDKAPFNLRAELERCADLLRGEAEQKGLALETDLDGADIVVEGDASRLRRLVLNLLSNAVRFTDSGAARLACRTLSRAEGRVAFEITVSDTGVGMDEETLGRLFRAYEQAEAFEKRRQGGAGLGLGIVGILTKLMGGSIEAKSAPGEGSVFTFRCELPEAPAPAESNVSKAPQKRSARVLVVEDNVPNQLVAKAFLKANGFEVTIANNGREAIEAVTRERFDLVLMDINMPVMDGLEATRILRQDPNYRSTPILAFTAHAIDEDRATILGAGLDDILKKPVTEKGLVERVNRWLSHPTPSDRAA